MASDQAFGLTTQADLDAERATARKLEGLWPGVRIHSFARVTVLDWYLEQNDTTVAVAEVKVRRVDASAYPTIYLSVSKYLALTLAHAALGVAPLFVVAYRDDLRWLDLRTFVPTSRPLVAGRRDRGATNDLEPMLEVPLSLTRPAADARPSWTTWNDHSTPAVGWSP